jgi:hypothetical protein
MAVLTDTKRAEVAQQFIQEHFVGLAKGADLSSTEIRTLVNDLDAWLDANQTAANNHGGGADQGQHDHEVRCPRVCRSKAQRRALG